MEDFKPVIEAKAVQRPYCLSAEIRVFYEEDVPYVELFSHDDMTTFETGVKVPFEALISWVASNVNGAKTFKRQFVK